MAFVDNEQHTWRRFEKYFLCPTNSLIDKHNKAVLEAFRAPTVNLHSSKTEELNFSSTDCQEKSSLGVCLARDDVHILSNWCTLHHLRLKNGAPVKFIRDILHLDIFIGRIFVVKGYSRRVVLVASLHSLDREWEAFSLRGIKVQFWNHVVMVTKTQFPIRLAFSGTIHNGRWQPLNKAIIDLLFQLIFPGQLYVAFYRVQKATDVLFLHREEYTPSNAAAICSTPVAVSNQILEEAVTFPEGR